MESRAIVRIALLAAVIAVLECSPGLCCHDCHGCPITAQTLGVMLAGIILGPRHGALAVLLFLFVVLLGAVAIGGSRWAWCVWAIGWFPAGLCSCAFVSGLAMARLKTLPVLRPRWLRRSRAASWWSMPAVFSA